MTILSPESIPTSTAVPGPMLAQMPSAGLSVCARGALTDDEREAHIRDAGRLMTDAFERGCRDEAMGWLSVQNRAIQARSPRQVARMEGCYFDWRGEADRLAIEGSMAA